ncbi:MAG: DUF692 family protein [Parasphingorhabdus sp.]|nr:DUF692 family protein [Parasphingorhabdus sp.]
MLPDHLSWSGNAHDRYADLLPVPYTAEALAHFSEQVNCVQDRLQRAMLIENPSRYLSYRDDSMTEIEFLQSLCRRTGCGLLFDINNVDVSAVNLDSLSLYRHDRPGDCLRNPSGRTQHRTPSQRTAENRRSRIGGQRSVLAAL